MRVAPLALSCLTILVTLASRTPVQAKTLSVSVSGELVTTDLYVMPGEPISLVFDGKKAHPRGPHNDFLRVVPNPNPDPNPAQNLTMLTLDVASDARGEWVVTFDAEGYIAYVTFRTSRDRAKVYNGAYFQYAKDEQLISQLQAEVKALDARVALQDMQNQQLLATNQLLTESKQALEQEVVELSTTSRDIHDDALLKAFSHQRNAIRLDDRAESCRQSEIEICGMSWEPIGDQGILRVAIRSRSLRGLFHRLRVLDDQGTNRAVKVSVAQGAPVPSEDIKLSIRPHTTVQVAILVTDPESLGGTATVTLVGTNIRPAVQKLYLAEQGPPTGRGRITIRLQPSIGAIWLANPVDKDELDATVLVGLGVRGSLAFNKYFAIEAELAGIRTNDAIFRDVSVEDMTGDLYRRMNGARFLLGAAARYGEKYQPYARLGVGAQGVNHDVRVMEGQNPTTGPGDGFAFSGIGWFGSGLDIHLGSHWTAGLGFSALFQTGGNPSIEGGIQLGYSWGGYEPEPW